MKQVTSDVSGPVVSEFKCSFCGKTFTGKYKYIYPVPDSKFIRSDGGIACMDCAPAIIDRQIALGLVIPVERHAHGE